MRRALLLLVTGTLLGCRSQAVEQVEAEFLLAAGDSTYWVRVLESGVRVRGSPIQLAWVGGRFHELYVADDDRSQPEAVIVGQRLFRRDIVTGDSLLVRHDSLIAEFAEWYERGSPDGRRLQPGEEPQEDAHIMAVSDLRILDQHGPYVSFDYSASVDLAGAESWERATRGVIDVMSGRRATLVGIFGSEEARRIRSVADSLFARTLDSIIASRDARAEAALGVLGEFRFDPEVFTLTTIERSPGVAFAIPGRGSGTGGMVLTLEPIRTAVPPWWNTVVPTLPHVLDDGVHRWLERERQVMARPEHGRFELVIRTAAGREHRAGRVPGPLWRIFWLDTPGTDSTMLRALARAFDEAAFYDEDVRTAMNDSSTSPSSAARPSRPVSYSLHETSEIMMPQHANNLGHVFGGVILSMMDRTAAVSAIRHARGTCVTVSVDRVDFREPIYLGELVIMKSSVNFAGRTSMEVGVRVEAENMLTGVRRHTNSCYLTFVAVDTDGRPVEVALVEPESPDQQRRYAAAQERRRRRLEERKAERR